MSTHPNITPEFKSQLDKHITRPYNEFDDPDLFPDDEVLDMLSCTCDDGSCPTCIEYYDQQADEERSTNINEQHYNTNNDI